MGFKLILPHGLILLYSNYTEYKARKKRPYNFDLIFSIGIACRPAYYLKKHKLRVLANPLDWMMSYPLTAVFELYKTKFKDFFLEYKSHEKNPAWFVDLKNEVTSIHYKQVATDNTAFNHKMVARFKKIDELLKSAKKVCFISNRKDSEEQLIEFLEKMSTIYDLQITLINIRDTKYLEQGQTTKKFRKIQVSEKLTFIEYQFSDVHEKGKDAKTNPDFWIGNESEWDRILNDISLNRSYWDYLNDSIAN